MFNRLHQIPHPQQPSSRRDRRRVINDLRARAAPREAPRALSGREVWPQAYALGPPAGTLSLLIRMRLRNYPDRSTTNSTFTAGTAGPNPGGVADG